jgi:GH15 family glucan-1,4-alpha-glucosidase
VRIGNAAADQFQIDVYGEVMDAFHLAREAGIEPLDDALRVQKALLEFLEGHWNDKDNGIWEVRGPRRDFTHSKLMSWVAFDRAVKAVEASALDGPAERWQRLRDHIHADICARGFDHRQNTFVQYYGGETLDASLLMMPLVGFLPATDPRMVGTVAAIERDLMRGDVIMRYASETGVDGLPPGEGAFLACSFWHVDNLALMGRTEEARSRFEHLAGLVNDVGLLAEEYDPIACRQLGNFPQAFSHVGLVNSAQNCVIAHGPAARRAHR